MAYATAGRGPALLVPAAWLSHLELAWQDPAVRGFYAPLAAHRTVVRYDKPGCGLSDPWPGHQTLEFEDLAAARSWYASARYQAAKGLREGAARLRMVAVQGVDATA